jgi:hypothetical protein
MVSYLVSSFSLLVLIAKNEKKQLQAKRRHARPENSSRWVWLLIFVILSEVMIIREKPKRLLDAFRI